ncbi:Inosose isomerase [Arthrobacter sp. 9V]|uniref:sugar phosphate isomerase/epimerase family protein n=1 Tax=Arthrobacter sp. 9V TaxID=2653132 RepID=UPI0012F09147|nr:sugar phosphate isomerase/epimerase [Arthrobacter sp. 9V]VXC42977.1 Inosose isomerase [Arthrobacter sp. 9V]
MFTLTCRASTLRPASLPERIKAASEAGYAGLGLRLQDIRNSGIDYPEIRKQLSRHGLSILELEHPWNWVSRAVSEDEEEIYRFTDAIGVRQLNVATFGEASTEVVSAAFGRLCDRAAAHGLLVGLEFLPFSFIRTLPQAWEIVLAADKDNGGILLDIWHWRRSHATFDDLAGIPAERITSLQLCDVRQPEPLSDLRHEARHHRELPGKETIDLVAGLAAQGISCPVSVEVFSDLLDTRPSVQTATASAEAGNWVLEKAGRIDCPDLKPIRRKRHRN